MLPTVPSDLVTLEASTSVRFATTVLDLLRDGHAFICAPPGDAGRSALVNPRRTIETVGDGGWLSPEDWSMPSGSEVAQISRTSGTEGARKSILLTRSNLKDVVTRLRNVGEVNGEIREYLGVPPYYSFGLGRLRVVASVGGSAFIPSRGFNPLEISELLSSGAINSVSAVPSLWRIALQSAHVFDHCRESLRWIEIGSQYMPAQEKSLLRELFPEAVIIQHYGLTEASRATFLRISDEPEHRLESVGRTYGDVEVRCRDDGRISLRGPNVAHAAIVDGRVVRLTDDAGWLTTSDLGTLADGFLTYRGRADFMINIGGQKVSPDELESAVQNSHPDLGPLAATRIKHPVLGEAVALATESADVTLRAKLEQASAEILRTSYGISARGAVCAVSVDAIPRTDTGKVQRGVLADECSTILATEAQEESRAESVDVARGDPRDPEVDVELESTLVTIWQSSLNVSTISIDASFYDHGGDSLSSVSLLLAIERAGLPRQVATRIFNGETIRSITTQDSTSSNPDESPGSPRDVGMAINVVRGIFTLLLIAIHWSWGFVGMLPVDADATMRRIALLVRFGTPSFAIAFGIGVGYFYLPQLAAGAFRVLPRILISASLVLGGILILGSARLVLTLASGESLGPRPETTFLYSVLLYYLLAVLSIPLWARIVMSRGKPWQNAIMVAAACFAIHELLVHLVPSSQLSNGLAETVRLMLIAKYNYFFMTAMCMGGVATGLHIHDSGERFFYHRWAYAKIGASLTCISSLILIEFESNGLGLDSTPAIATIGAYFGIVLACVSVVSACIRTLRSNTVGRHAIALLSACGVLSLAGYVGHSLVLPAKEVMKLAGIPNSVGLVIAMAAFFAAGGYLVKRVARVFN